MAKAELELHGTEGIPWRHAEGYPEGVSEKILNRDPETGSYTRLLKFEPGATTTETMTHDHYEEVYVIKGELIDLVQNLTCKEGFYGYRHPGMKHGPYTSPTGCITFEIKTYEK